LIFLTYSIPAFQAVRQCHSRTLCALWRIDPGIYNIVTCCNEWIPAFAGMTLWSD